MDKPQLFIFAEVRSLVATICMILLLFSCQEKKTKLSYFKIVDYEKEFRKNNNIKKIYFKYKTDSTYSFKRDTTFIMEEQHFDTTGNLTYYRFFKDKSTMQYDSLGLLKYKTVSDFFDYNEDFSVKNYFDFETKKIYQTWQLALWKKPIIDTVIFFFNDSYFLVEEKGKSHGVGNTIEGYGSNYIKKYFYDENNRLLKSKTEFYRLIQETSAPKWIITAEKIETFYLKDNLLAKKIDTLNLYERDAKIEEFMADKVIKIKHFSDSAIVEEGTSFEKKETFPHRKKIFNYEKY